MYIDLDIPVKTASFGKVVWRKGYWHGGRRLNYNIVLYCTGGYAEIKIEENIYHLRSGCMMFIPSSSFYTPLDAENFEYYFVHFSATLLKEGKIPASVTVIAHTQLDEGHGYDCNSNLPSFVAISILKNDIPAAIPDLFHRADRLRPNKSYFDKLMLDSILREILIVAYKSDNDTTQNSHIGSITEYIDSHYSSPITLTTLSETFHLTPSYIARLFKTDTGEKPSEYLNRVRISAASVFLTNTDMSITEISEKVGYSSVYYFSRIFKKIKGRTPTEIRNGAYDK